MVLGPSDVHLWYRVTGSLDDAGRDAAVSLLSVEERIRHDRFVFDRDRRDFAEAHALVRVVLSMYEDVAPASWRFDTTDRGKPFLPPGQAGVPPLAFNLSHARGLVACGVTRDADIGVDVEGTDRATDSLAIARRYFSPAEHTFLAAVTAGQRPARFTELWTLKEAFIKASGWGLGQALDEFGFELAGDSAIRFMAPPGTNPDHWAFALFAPTPRTRMAVAIRSRMPTAHGIVARGYDGRPADTPLESLRISQAVSSQRRP